MTSETKQRVRDVIRKCVSGERCLLTMTAAFTAVLEESESPEVAVLKIARALHDETAPDVVLQRPERYRVKVRVGAAHIEPPRLTPDLVGKDLPQIATMLRHRLGYHPQAPGLRPHGTLTIHDLVKGGVAQTHLYAV